MNVLIQVWRSDSSEPREIACAMPALPRRGDTILLDVNTEERVEVRGIEWEPLDDGPRVWRAVVACQEANLS